VTSTSQLAASAGVGHRAQGAPRLTVVLVTADDFSSVALTWDHLRRQEDPACLEVLVVGPVAAAPGLPRDHPFCRAAWVPVAAVPSLDRARVAALPEVTAPAVAFVEDHAFPEPGWAGAILAAHKPEAAPPPVAVGGAMINANPATLLSWANLLTAYGDWTAGGAEPGGANVPATGSATGSTTVPASDRVAALPGHNASYAMAALAAIAERRAPGELEDLFARGGGLHDELVADGGELRLASGARIAHVNPSRLASTVLLRIDAGRLYAAGRYRAEGWGALRRLVYAAASPAIPAVRWLRHRREMLAGRRPRRTPRQRLALALGYGLDAVGQAVGYLFAAGDSLERLEAFEIDRWRHLTRADRRRFE